ncbi:hypothetical protein FB446DRAFT_419595 [Lentinula raphanica]|nr:hypothetical protein FB446DRAFT_419595 [Lentinula raphanica]
MRLPSSAALWAPFVLCLIVQSVDGSPMEYRPDSEVTATRSDGSSTNENLDFPPYSILFAKPGASIKEAQKSLLKVNPRMAAIGRRIVYEALVYGGDAEGLSKSMIKVQNKLDDRAEGSPKERLELYFSGSEESERCPPKNPASGSRNPNDGIWTVKWNVNPDFQAIQFKENPGTTKVDQLERTKTT